MFLALLIVAGCGKQPATQAESQPQQNESVRGNAELLVDGLTGRQAVRSGKKAMSEIQDISKKKNQELNETLGE